MTVTYIYQFQFFPKRWLAPLPPPSCYNENEDLLKTLEFRRMIAPFLRDWLNVLNTWRFCLKFGIMPLIILFLILGMGLNTFLILLVIVLLILIIVWARIRMYQRTAAIIEVIIDEVLFTEYGIRLPKIIDNEQ